MITEFRLFNQSRRRDRDGMGFGDVMSSASSLARGLGVELIHSRHQQRLLYRDIQPRQTTPTWSRLLVGGQAAGGLYDVGIRLA